MLFLGKWVVYLGREREVMGVAKKKECPAFPTAEDFTEAAEEYFADCDGKGELYGEAGLCLALSRRSANGRPVTLGELRDWWDGEACPHLKDAARVAYLRIQDQIERDPRFQKSGMTSKAVFLLKQERLGGYADKGEQKAKARVTITYEGSMDETDLE